MEPSDTARRQVYGEGEFRWRAAVHHGVRGGDIGKRQGQSIHAHYEIFFLCVTADHRKSRKLHVVRQGTDHAGVIAEGRLEPQLGKHFARSGAHFAPGPGKYRRPLAQFPLETGKGTLDIGAQIFGRALGNQHMAGRMRPDRDAGIPEFADFIPGQIGRQAHIGWVGRDEQGEGQASLFQAQPCLFVNRPEGIVDRDRHRAIRQLFALLDRREDIR